jgi:hypothetical protein
LRSYPRMSSSKTASVLCSMLPRVITVKTNMKRSWISIRNQEPLPLR